MKLRNILRGGALTAAAAVTALSLAAVCAADDDEMIFPGDEQTEIETITSGDYEYSVMVGAGDSTQKAACIEHYHGTETEVVIPDTLDGLPVVSLGDYAFVSAQLMQKVTIPKSILGFGTFTFANCTNLTEFAVEEGSEFCESIDGVLYTADGSALLRYPIGTRPTEVTVKEGIIGIGNVAFTNALTLTAVNLPASLEYIGTSAFSDCNSLKELVFPDKITEIPAYCCNNCTALERVTLPSGLTDIGVAAFTNTVLTEVTIPDGCKKIGQQAFANTKLTEITVPASVESIGYSAFGWKLFTDMLSMDDTFIIRGYAGTAAEVYANDTENGNHFTFVDVEESGTTTVSSESLPVEKTGTGAVKIIGITVCCLLLCAIAVIAVVTGKKKPQPAQKQEEAPAQQDDAEE